jgi:protein-ribulosamine 3-kinase
VARNWTYYFTRLLEQFFYREAASNGADEECEKTFEVLKSNVIPMILDPRQIDGRILKPALIHGDLWEENTGTELNTGEPIVSDAAAHYAHNKFELGMWRRDIVRFSESFFHQYLRHVPPSEPQEQ